MSETAVETAAPVAAKPATKKKGRTGKKKDQDTRFDASNRKLLKSLVPEAGINQESLETLNHMTTEFIEALVREIRSLMEASGKKTVQTVEVIAAIRNVIGNKALRESLINDVRENLHRFNTQTSRKKQKKAAAEEAKKNEGAAVEQKAE